ncbi:MULTISPECIES: hypothetical protein [Pseudomonas]|uniref:Uncharacterized protein n=3 Tax=Pseudomonas TaxID=286 RepID=A0ABX6HHR4_9PSED|nr:MULTISPECIES: hypothetical protein [Pseudomonas]MBC3957147.1 hypothetical protein [Pseudomonas triticifolii]QHF05141.1 hypothetical protein N015_23135 [Pseudomonas asturiensis]
MEALLEVVLTAICYPIGWPIVKLVTRGKYPLPGSWFSETAPAQWAVGTGLAVLVVLMMALFGQFVF